MRERFKKYRKFFTDKKFRRKLREQSRKAGIKVVYTALLLFHAYRRKETPTWARSTILGVLGYFLAPVDLIPDLTPILGYTDDLGVLAFGLVTIAAYVNEDVKEKARTQLAKWFGDFDEKEIEEIDEQL